MPEPRCLSPAANSLHFRSAGRHVLNRRCLSPAASSSHFRVADRQVPKPRCLSPAAHSLDVRIAGRQVSDLHGVSKQLYLARIAWTPFTGTGGSREPPVPLKKRPPKMAFAHFVWHFIDGKPWDSTTIIAKKCCLGSTRRFHYVRDQNLTFP